MVTSRMCFAGKVMRECEMCGCGVSIQSGMGLVVRGVDILVVWVCLIENSELQVSSQEYEVDVVPRGNKCSF
jgi:hypothetical protein